MKSNPLSQPCVTRMVNYWAYRSSRRWPSFAKDFRQELLIHVLEVAKKWRPALGPFDSYLYQGLRWKALSLQKTILRIRDLPSDIDASELEVPSMEDHSEGSYSYLVDKVLERLKGLQSSQGVLQMFRLLVDPPTEDEVPFRETKPKTKHLNNQHIADLLCLNVRQVYEFRKEVETAVMDVLTDA